MILSFIVFFLKAKQVGGGDSVAIRVPIHAPQDSYLSSISRKLKKKKKKRR